MKALASSPAGWFINEENLETLADVAAPDMFLKTTNAVEQILGQVLLELEPPLGRVFPTPCGREERSAIRTESQRRSRTPTDPKTTMPSQSVTLPYHQNHPKPATTRYTKPATVFLYTL